MPNPRRQDRELDALYASLPQLECQGFCHDSCGPVEVSVRERGRIVERAKKPLKACGPGGMCSMLTPEGRCSVYEIRPMICRLWGMVRSLPCPYGCRPQGGLLSDREGMRLAIEAERIGGSPAGEGWARNAKAALEGMSDSEVEALARNVISSRRATLEGRAVTLQRAGNRMPFEQEGLPWGKHALAFPKENDD